MSRKIKSIMVAAMAAAVMSIPAYAATPSEAAPQTEASSIDQLESLPDQVNPDVSDAPEETHAASETEQPSKRSDLPLFVGAGISVLVFGGVVVFCRMKGNR